jgi:Protein phosphatase 2C
MMCWFLQVWQTSWGGYTVAEELGVIGEPETYVRRLSSKNPFIVVATDGVFEFLTSQMVVDMVRACIHLPARPPACLSQTWSVGGTRAACAGYTCASALGVHRRAMLCGCAEPDAPARTQVMPSGCSNKYPYWHAVMRRQVAPSKCHIARGSQDGSWPHSRGVLNSLSPIACCASNLGLFTGCQV